MTDLFIQGSNPLRSSMKVQKQVTASAGFKIPQESIDKKAHRNKHTSNALGDDLPTREELMKNLGIDPHSAARSDVAANLSQEARPHQDDQDLRLQRLRVNRQMIKDKQEAIYDIPEEPQPVDLNRFKSTKVQQAVVQDFDALIDKHRKKMKPIENQYFENRVQDDRYNPLRPHQESDSHARLDQSQSHRPILRNPKRTFSPSVKVTYHKSQSKKSLSKMRDEQQDWDGKHGEFLKSVMPPEKSRQVRSQSAMIKDDDFNQRFKQYLRQRKNEEQRRRVEEDEEPKEFDLFQSTSPNRNRWGVKHKHKAHFIDRSVSKESKGTRSRQSRSKSNKDDELFLIQHFFRQIDVNNLAKVDKISTIKYLVKNPQVMDAFDLNSNTLNKQINAYPTKDKTSFTFEEFSQFLRKNRQKHQIEHSGHENFGGVSQIAQQSATTAACLLNTDQIKLLKNVFNRLDIGGDMVVNRIQFMQELRNDINVVRILHVQAAYIPSIDKILTLDKTLSQVEQSYFSAQDKESVEFISWEQFMEYFNQGGNEQGLKQKIAFASIQSQLEDNIDDQDRVDISGEMQQMIKNQFDSLQEGNYVQTVYLNDAIRRHPLYSENKKEVARQKASKFALRAETLEEVLWRVEEEGHEFVSLAEFMSYFTRRGKPKFVEGNAEYDMMQSMARSIDVTDGYLKKNQQQQGQSYIDGYDSDPEIHTYQNKMLPRQRFARQTSADPHITFSHRLKYQPEQQTQQPPQKPQKLKKQDFLEAIQPRTSDFGAHNKPSDYHHTITAPRPFQFEQRDHSRSLSIRRRKFEAMLAEKKEEEDKLVKNHFKAKEVPSHVREPLYQQLKAQNESRRQQVKKDSVAITLQNQRPFSFYYRKDDKPRKKKYWERQQFVFKAKNIPWHVHVNLFEQMQTAEKDARQEKIAKHAQELAMMSQMPERMERHRRMKEASDLEKKTVKVDNKFYSHTHQPPKAKPIPDFERIHLAFQDQMEKKKQAMRTTEPQEFNFQHSTKGAVREYLDNENYLTKMMTVPQKVDKVQEARQKMEKKPQIQPGSTKKWVATLEQRNKEREEKRKQEEARKKEEQDRLDRKEKVYWEEQIDNEIVQKQSAELQGNLEQQQEIKGGAGEKIGKVQGGGEAAKQVIQVVEGGETEECIKLAIAN